MLSHDATHRPSTADDAATLPPDDGSNQPHERAETDRPDTPSLEGGTPLPEEVTGRASGTAEDLMALFSNDSSDHLADGFRGGSAEESVAQDQADGTADPADGAA